MLILLPPSEGKTPPASGAPLDLATLSFDGLTRTRRGVLSALIRFCSSEPATASTALGLGPTQAGHVQANASLKRAPAGLAIDVYTGVLFEALDAGSLRAAERRRLNRLVAISSALFGLVRPDDLIPAYRLSGDTCLPALGTMPAVWREHVSRELAQQQGVLLDLRSGSYAALGPIPPGIAGRSVVGRVLHEHEGKRSIVSHHNKATKGRIVRSLAQATTHPKTIADLIDVLGALGYQAELQAPMRQGAPAIVDIIVREV